MSNKLKGKHLAVGTWGSPWRYVRALEVPERVRVWLQDKLITRGRWVDLYLPVNASTPGVVPCTCVKNTSDSSDRACLTCYGAKFAPGYVKFLRETLFWCSAESSSFTLTNVLVSTTKKANVFVLADGQTSGTIVTTDKAYDNAPGVDWEVKLEAYRRATGSTFLLEYSKDSGVSWHTISLTEVPSPGFGFTGTISGLSLLGSGVIRFRITMTRLSANDLTPSSEIVRLRRVRTENENESLQDQRPDHVSGSILVLRPWVQEVDELQAGRGRLIEHMADKTWTAPLDLFDTSLTVDTPPCRIVDELGPHPIYQLVSGVQQSTRYAIVKVSYNEAMGIFTQMWLDDRRIQDGESGHLVW